MKNVISAYQQSGKEVPVLFDKVSTIEGETVDTKEYRKSLTKPVEEVRKPLVGSPFSLYLDGFA